MKMTKELVESIKSKLNKEEMDAIVEIINLLYKGASLLQHKCNEEVRDTFVSLFGENPFEGHVLSGSDWSEKAYEFFDLVYKGESNDNQRSS